VPPLAHILLLRKDLFLHLGFTIHIISSMFRQNSKRESPEWKTIADHYPWTESPLIVSAPMRLISTAPLALSVSSNKGLGFLGVGTDVGTLSDLLKSTTQSLEDRKFSFKPGEVPYGILPVGIGFICWGADLSAALAILKQEPLKPAAVWLFAPKSDDELIQWVDGIRGVCDGKTKIWVQVGSVANALEVARTCKPDVLVIQGADAGGHGLAQSCSIITLLPECADALKSEGFDDIVLIAAGGIMDGRGIAAALVLGADGVCMGTRFLASTEANISKGYRRDVIKAADGGTSTMRTSVYDKVRGTDGWPETYNARGVLNHSFWDHAKGMDEEENKRLYEEALKKGDDGWGEHGRLTTYAGTGVGFVKAEMSVVDIMNEVRQGVRMRLEN